MIGIHRRKRVEGWALEISEADAKGAPSTLRQRLGEDNRLWLIAAGVIIILAFFMIMRAKPSDGAIERKSKSLPTFTGTYTDQKHQVFASEFLKNKRYSVSVLEASYVSDGVFRLVLASNASPDDIEYVSKMAAKLIEYRVHERAVVHTCLKDSSTGVVKKIAQTAWDPGKSSFVITYDDVSK